MFSVSSELCELPLETLDSKMVIIRTGVFAGLNSVEFRCELVLIAIISERTTASFTRSLWQRRGEEVEESSN